MWRHFSQTKLLAPARYEPPLQTNFQVAFSLLALCHLFAFRCDSLFKQRGFLRELFELLEMNFPSSIDVRRIESSQNHKSAQINKKKISQNKKRRFIMCRTSNFTKKFTPSYSGGTGFLGPNTGHPDQGFSRFSSVPPVNAGIVP
jgi:hypothetical protein